MVTTIRRGRRAVGAPSREMQFVAFQLAGTDYGVEVAEVFGIYHGLPIIPTPDSPAYYAGEVQLVDRRIPVVNLRRFAGLHDAQTLRSPHWILIVDSTKGPLGFVVDKVSEVVKLTPSALTITDEAATGPVGDYVMAVARHDSRPLYLPDFSRLMRDAAQ